MQSSYAVRARAIEKRFRDVVALDGVDLDVASGEVHGVIGPNGAGKTTLLSLLLGLADADSGRIEILGTIVGRGRATSPRVAGFVDGPAVYPSLTARQNVDAIASLRHGRRTDSGDTESVLARVGLVDVADDRVAGFSLGMRQRLGLAVALAMRPKLLILDEPTNGLDPAAKRHVHGIITELAASGTAVVLSSHHMDDVATLCTDVSLLCGGRVVFSGPVAKLAAECGDLDYRVVTSNQELARALMRETPGLRVRSDAPGALLVRGPLQCVDLLVFRLARAGVAVRELAPVMSPLESAYLALTDSANAADGGDLQR